MTNKQFWILTILLVVSMVLDFTFFAVTTNITGLLSAEAPESMASEVEDVYYESYEEPTPNLVACPDIRVGLKRGMTDGDKPGSITELQQFLIASGYDLGGLPNGDFGPMTQAALKKFQTDQNISATGILDSEAFTAIMNVCTVL